MTTCGWLEKKRTAKGKTKKRWWAIDGEILLSFKSNKSDSPEKKIKLRPLEATEEGEREIMLKDIKKGKVVYYLVAPTPADRKIWLTSIHTAQRTSVTTQTNVEDKESNDQSENNYSETTDYDKSETVDNLSDDDLDGSFEEMEDSDVGDKKKKKIVSEKNRFSIRKKVMKKLHIHEKEDDKKSKTPEKHTPLSATAPSHTLQNSASIPNTANDEVIVTIPKSASSHSISSSLSSSSKTIKSVIGTAISPIENIFHQSDEKTPEKKKSKEKKRKSDDETSNKHHSFDGRVALDWEINANHTSSPQNDERKKKNDDNNGNNNSSNNNSVNMRTLSDEYKSEELHQLRKLLLEKEQLISEQSTQLHIQSLELDQRSRNLDSLTTQLNLLNAKCIDSELQLFEANKRCAASDDSLRSARSEIDNLKISQSEENAAFAAQIAEKEKKLKKLRKTASKKEADFTAQLSQLDSSNHELQEKIAEIEKLNLQVKEKDASVTQLRSSLDDALHEKQLLEQRLAESTEKKKEKKEKSRSVKSHQAAVAEEDHNKVAEQSAVILDLQKIIEEKDQYLAQLTNDLSEKEKQLKKKKKLIKKKDQLLSAEKQPGSPSSSLPSLVENVHEKDIKSSNSNSDLQTSQQLQQYEQKHQRQQQLIEQLMHEVEDLKKQKRQIEDEKKNQIATLTIEKEALSNRLVELKHVIETEDSSKSKRKSKKLDSKKMNAEMAMIAERNAQTAATNENEMIVQLNVELEKRQKEIKKLKSELKDQTDGSAHLLNDMKEKNVLLNSKITELNEKNILISLLTQEKDQLLKHMQSIEESAQHNKEVNNLVKSLSSPNSKSASSTSNESGSKSSLRSGSLTDNAKSSVDLKTKIILVLVFIILVMWYF